jgi:hypothetical protein
MLMTGIAPTATKAPAHAVQPTSAVAYRRPFHANAAWNVKVAGLPRDVGSLWLATALWDKATSARPGNFNVGFDEYTYPVYNVSGATGWYPVTVRNPSWGSNLVGKKIPWNPKWRPSAGSDGQIIVLDAPTGREWDLWQASFANGRVTISNGNLVPGSYWTSAAGFKPSRGVGIQYLAMLVRATEIDRGLIPHALSMPIRNSGPTYVAPGTKSDGSTVGGIPEGTRFALQVTNQEIFNWVVALPAPVRRAALILAVALRDYGWFITDTAGGATFQLADTATASWDRHGLPRVSAGGNVYPRDLFDGLITKDRIYALAPSDRY